DQLFQRHQTASLPSEEERAANLKRKEELAARVEALVDAPDLKETAEAVKKLQEEWKSIGATDREPGEAAWKRFRGACDRFFERRKAHFDQLDEERAENLKRKEELVAKVEALLEAADREEAVKQVKGFQAEWKKIGPAPREQADEIWQRFRDACDRFFQGP